MRITAPPISFHRAAGNRPTELRSTAAVRLRLLEQWRAAPRRRRNRAEQRPEEAS